MHIVDRTAGCPAWTLARPFSLMLWMTSFDFDADGTAVNSAVPGGRFAS
jgi:hypothetical protein